MSAVSVSTTLDCTPERAFRLLEDIKALQQVIAGARHIRHFDPRWPEPGTEFHHTVGVRPFVVRDRTRVLQEEPGRRLLLEAHLKPFGVFHVDFLFEACESGTRLTVREEPVSGPVSHPSLKGLVGAAVKLRNLEICRRYRHLIRKREEQSARYA